MKITNISLQTKNPDRVNVSVDGSFLFSLDIAQVGDLGLKVGKDYTESELAELMNESQFGKLYARSLEYSLMRPHSAREMKDYLWRKTRETAYRSRKSGEIKKKPGVSQEIADRVYTKLVEKGYIDDERFAVWWAESRNLVKGASSRKLRSELQAKGVAPGIIDTVLNDSERTDDQEIQKIIAKKRSKYPDEQKLMQYLARQGFSYDTISAALRRDID